MSQWCPWAYTATNSALKSIILPRRCQDGIFKLHNHKVYLKLNFRGEKKKEGKSPACCWRFGCSSSHKSLTSCLHRQINTQSKDGVVRNIFLPGSYTQRNVRGWIRSQKRALIRFGLDHRMDSCLFWLKVLTYESFEFWYVEDFNHHRITREKETDG